LSIKSDKWIRREAEKGMIEPFEAGQVRTNGSGERLISYGTALTILKYSPISIRPLLIQKISLSTVLSILPVMFVLFRPIPLHWHARLSILKYPETY